MMKCCLRCITVYSISIRSTSHKGDELAVAEEDAVYVHVCVHTRTDLSMLCNVSIYGMCFPAEMTTPTVLSTHTHTSHPVVPLGGVGHLQHGS